MKDIKSLYQSAKFGRSGDQTAYIEAVNDLCRNDPTGYLSNLEYIISSGHGLSSFKTFREQYQLPLAGYRKLAQVAETLLEKALGSSVDGNTYTEFTTEIGSYLEEANQYLTNHQHLLAMFESFEHELPPIYLETYYDHVVSKPGYTGVPVINTYGPGVLPDLIIEASNNNTLDYLLEYVDQNILFGTPSMKQWIVEAAKDIKLNDKSKKIVDKITKDSLDGVVRSVKLRRAILYRESMLMGDDAEMVYTEDEITSLRDYIAFQEYMVTALYTDKARSQLNQVICETYDELDGLVAEDESCSDITQLLPGPWEIIKEGTNESPLISTMINNIMNNSRQPKEKKEKAVAAIRAAYKASADYAEHLKNKYMRAGNYNIEKADKEHADKLGKEFGRIDREFWANESVNVELVTEEAISHKDKGTIPKYLQKHHSALNYGEDDDAPPKKTDKPESDEDPYAKEVDAKLDDYTRSPLPSSGEEEDENNKDTSKKGQVSNYYYYNYTNSFNKHRNSKDDHSKHNTVNDHSTKTNDDHSTGKRIHSDDNNSHNRKITPKTETAMWDLDLGNIPYYENSAEDEIVVKAHNGIAGILWDKVLTIECICKFKNIPDDCKKDFNQMVEYCDGLTVDAVCHWIYLKHPATKTNIIGLKTSTDAPFKIGIEKRDNEIVFANNMNADKQGTEIILSLEDKSIYEQEYGCDSDGKQTKGRRKKLYPDFTTFANDGFGLSDDYNKNAWQGKIGCLSNLAGKFIKKAGIINEAAEYYGESFADDYEVIFDANGGKHIKCKHCGAHLNWGETCDCQDDDKPKKESVDDLFDTVITESNETNKDTVKKILEKLKLLRKEIMSIISPAIKDAVSADNKDKGLFSAKVQYPMISAKFARANKGSYSDMLMKRTIEKNLHDLTDTRMKVWDNIIILLNISIGSTFSSQESKSFNLYVSTIKKSLDKLVKDGKISFQQNYVQSITYIDFPIYINKKYILDGINLDDTSLTEANIINMVDTFITEAGEVGSADDNKPESDHPIKDTLQDVDRVLTKTGANIKKTTNDAINVGKAAVKPVKRTAGWINSLVDRFRDANETNIKEKLADPRARKGLYATIKKCLGAGMLFKAGLLTNPLFLFLAVTKKLHDRSNTGRLRMEIIGELRAEIDIIDEKIRDADRNNDNGAKYKLMRIKNEMEKKLVRVGGSKAEQKIYKPKGFDRSI